MTCHSPATLPTRMIRIEPLCCHAVLHNLILHDNHLSEVRVWIYLLSKLGSSTSQLQAIILQYAQMPPVSGLATCRQLEVSYNSIRSIESISNLPSASLQHLYAACNKILKIQVAALRDTCVKKCSLNLICSHLCKALKMMWYHYTYTFTSIQ